MSRGAKVILSWGIIFGLILITSPPLLRCQASGTGNLVGFVYDQDGSTPITGAVVMMKNVTTGAVLESAKSDALGVFRVEGLGVGIYAVGVSSDQGSFNSGDFVGITPNETAKISIVLNPYDAQTVQAAQAVARDQGEKGESFVGRIVKYSPEAREADVFIERGLLQTGDRIRVKGGTTDFFQDARILDARGIKARRILSGETGAMKVTGACASGDLVYVVCKRGVPPFFLAPLGIAAITGGASLVGLEEEERLSPEIPPRIKK
jgi:hypothetical protein